MKKTFLSIFVVFVTSSTFAQSWNLTGNSGTTPGTNFLGTTDNQSLLFKINNLNSGLISTSGNNTGLGYNTFLVQTTGSSNTGFGTDSFYSNTTGSYNTAAGPVSLPYNTTGSANVALGYSGLYMNTTGSWNTGIGVNPILFNVSGNNNTGFGMIPLQQNTTGSNNSAFGDRVLYHTTTGSFNTAIGDSALVFNTTGGNNIGLGSQSGVNISTGSNNIAIGRSINVPDGTANQQLVIGNGNTIWLRGVNGAISLPGTLAVAADNTGATYLATGYLLAVNGNAIATGLVVQMRTNWPDYVFKPGYKLPALAEVKIYIEKNQHLPDMPSGQEITINGLDLGEMSKILTKKVEELTLYLIENDKEMTDTQISTALLEKKANNREERLKKLEDQLQAIAKFSKRTDYKLINRIEK